jgi:hypothetical protein
MPPGCCRGIFLLQQPCQSFGCQSSIAHCTCQFVSLFMVDIKVCKWGVIEAKQAFGAWRAALFLRF